MDAIRIPIKALSANDAWATNKRGYMYRTAEYYDFKKQVKSLLETKHIDIPDGLVEFRANYGVSRTDLDNCIKPFLDTLEEIYHFDDSVVDDIHTRKHRVRPGCEYIEFTIEPLEDELPLDFPGDPNCMRKRMSEMENNSDEMREYYKD